MSSPSSALQRFDTHIHLYQPSRPGGVRWPTPEARSLYRDVLPAEYRELAQRHGIVAAGIVEASPIDADNEWLADLVRGDDLFRFIVAQVEVGGPSFAESLARLRREALVVGVRSFLWGTPLTLDSGQRADLARLCEAGMTLDIISRRDHNPKAMVGKLADEFSALPIMIDHLGGARGEVPAKRWWDDMQQLARRPNVFVKFSSFYDMFGPGPEVDPWPSPTALSAYKPHFDVVIDSFGPERLVWASNWPVCTLGGDFGRQIELAEQYLAGFGAGVRNKVMFENAERFYRRRLGNAREGM